MSYIKEFVQWPYQNAHYQSFSPTTHTYSEVYTLSISSSLFHSPLYHSVSRSSILCLYLFLSNTHTLGTVCHPCSLPSSIFVENFSCHCVLLCHPCYCNSWLKASPELWHSSRSPHFQLAFWTWNHTTLGPTHTLFVSMVIKETVNLFASANVVKLLENSRALSSMNTYNISHIRKCTDCTLWDVAANIFLRSINVYFNESAHRINLGPSSTVPKADSAKPMYRNLTEKCDKVDVWKLRMTCKFCSIFASF